MTDPHDMDRALGRAIGDLVPQPPPAPDRAVAVLARARRTRRRRSATVTLVAAGAVAAVAVTAAGLGSTTGRAGPGTSSTTAIADPTPAPPADVACPTPMRRGDPNVDRTDSRPLPDGATSARLCPTSEPGHGWFAPPADALVTGVDRIVEDIAARPALRPPAACDLNAGLNYWLVLAYPDGSERVVHGDLGGCRGVEGAGATRTGADQVLARFIRLLREQRAVSEPPRTATITCSDGEPSYSPLARSLDAEHAVLRWRRTDVESEAAWACSPIPDEDLRVILTDLGDPANEATVGETDCRQATLQLEIVGVDDWGDVGTTMGDCGAWAVDDTHTRLLGPKAQAIVDRIVSADGRSAPSEPTPDLDPGEVLALMVDLVNDGRLDEARDLGAQQLIALDGRLDVKIDGYRLIPGTVLAEVDALLRVVPPGGGVGDYRQTRFVFYRQSDAEPWTLVELSLGSVVDTGR